MLPEKNRYRYEYDDDKRVLTHYNYYTWDYQKEKARDTLVFRTSYPPIRIQAKQRVYMDISTEIVDAVGMKERMNSGTFYIIGWNQYFEEKVEGKDPSALVYVNANEGKTESARVSAEAPEGKEVGDIMTIHAITNTSSSRDIETIWTYRWQ